MTRADIAYARELGLYDQAAGDRQGRRRRDRGARPSDDDPDAPSAGRVSATPSTRSTSTARRWARPCTMAGARADADGDRRDGRYSRNRAPSARRVRAPGRIRWATRRPWSSRARVKPMDDVLCEYYLRFMARDQPGVLGAIASVLGRNGISIASVIQQERGSGDHGAGYHANASRPASAI